MGEGRVGVSSTGSGWFMVSLSNHHPPLNPLLSLSADRQEGRGYFDSRQLAGELFTMENYWF